jgi:hypothetical protein
MSASSLIASGRREMVTAVDKGLLGPPEVAARNNLWTIKARQAPWPFFADMAAALESRRLAQAKELRAAHLAVDASKARDLPGLVHEWVGRWG